MIYTMHAAFDAVNEMQGIDTMRILIIEDEKKTNQYLVKGLTEHEFVADASHTGEVLTRAFAGTGHQFR